MPNIPYPAPGFLILALLFDDPTSLSWIIRSSCAFCSRAAFANGGLGSRGQCSNLIHSLNLLLRYNYLSAAPVMCFYYQFCDESCRLSKHKIF
jgi:hypothetical protein